MRFLVVCGCAVLLGLSGCATAPVAQAPAHLNAHPVSAFELDGRIALRYGRESSLANIHWQHTPARDTLALSTPLGQTVAVLIRDSTGVTLTDSGGHIHTASSLEDLTGQLLGWRLPLQDLTYWVAGSAIPQLPYRVNTDSATGMIELAQSDWLVTYKRWTMAEGKELPDNLVVSGAGVTVHLIVGEWLQAR